MSLGYGDTARLPIGFPRVSGDEPAVASVKYADLMFSPRERG